MSDDLKPALSAEEWAVPVDEYASTSERRTIRSQLWTFENNVQVSVGTDGTFVNWDGAVYDSGMQALGDKHLAVLALLNFALPDDSPYKITRADVDDLLLATHNVESLANQVEDNPMTGGSKMPTVLRARVARLRMLAAKLAALLPPETP